VDELPAVNATLNAISTVLLTVGFQFIKRRQIERHRATMIVAFCISIVFLACYLLHKWWLYQTTGSWNTTFKGQGTWRIVYFVLLITHVILAATVPFLASITVFRGLKRMDAKHRRIAKVTYPIWLYVSVTGVLVYFMLYRWFV